MLHNVVMNEDDDDVDTDDDRKDVLFFFLSLNGLILSQLYSRRNPLQKNLRRN